MPRAEIRNTVDRADLGVLGEKLGGDFLPRGTLQQAAGYMCVVKGNAAGLGLFKPCTWEGRKDWPLAISWEIPSEPLEYPSR